MASGEWEEDGYFLSSPIGGKREKQVESEKR